MRVEWDETKNETNREKHGIDFEIAQYVFEDPCIVLFVDGVVDGEERWHGIGLIAEIQGTLLVVHTHRDEPEVVRIISARRATRKERKLYEEANA